MLKGFAIFSFLCLALISCEQKSAELEKPKDLLDKNKMAAVLTDITLMEATANVQATQNSANEQVLKFNVYKQHMISRAQYETSLKYYSSNASEFKEVYDIVLQNLNKQK